MSEDTERIKERLDLAEVIGEYVTLQRMGPHFKALCPFHQEKTPSFVVSPTKGIWHCFGCGKGGDVFTFVQEVEGMDFGEALRMLAERAGVTLSNRPSTEATSQRQRLFDLLAAAARFYHELLVRHAAGKKALAYLKKRGVSNESIETFQVGYAPMAWDTIQKALQKKGYTHDEMVAAGVIGKSDTGKYFDRFRGRIMFPVADLQGRVVAFGGRITPEAMTGNEGKYINSPETSLYSKRHTVYNLHRAKNALRGNVPCIVVEGYMDVVMLVQTGVLNVVGSSGTAFTAEHIAQLNRFTNTLHFAFDADRAGYKAAFAATHAALSAGMRVATIQFPAGKDPADMVLEAPKEVAEYVGKPRSLTSLLLESLRKAAPAGRVTDDDVQQVLSLVRRVGNPIQQGEMVQEIANTLHVPEARLLKWLQEVSVPETREAGPAATEEDTAIRLPEHQLLGLSILDANARQEVFPQLSHELFLDAAAGELYKVLQHLSQNISEFFSMSADELLTSIPSTQLALAEAVRVLSSDRLAVSDRSAVVEAQTLARFLQRRFLERRLTSLQHQLSAGTAAERHELMQQFQSVAEQLEQVRAHQ